MTLRNDLHMDILYMDVELIQWDGKVLWINMDRLLDWWRACLALQVLQRCVFGLTEKHLELGQNNGFSIYHVPKTELYHVPKHHGIDICTWFMHLFNEVLGPAMAK